MGFENRVNIKMALFIVFIITLILGYMIIWSPFVSRLSKDVKFNLKFIDIAHKTNANNYSNTHNYENSEDTRVPQ